MNGSSRALPIYRSLAMLVLISFLCTVNAVEGAPQKKMPAVHTSVAAPEVYLAAPPPFIRPENQQFFVAIEIPYDLYYLGGTFYLYVRGVWFASDFFEGPWEQLGRQRVPEVFRTHSVTYLREVRDHAAQQYADQQEGWPKDALFIPECSAVDDDPADGIRDSDAMTADNDLEQATLKSKGE